MSRWQSYLLHGRNTKSYTFRASLRHAGRGIWWGVLGEVNIRRQLVGFVFIVIVGWWLDAAVWQWVVLLLVAMLVLAAEFANSALESLADGIHPDYNEHIQRAKDMSAAAVLLISLLAVLVGVMLLGPLLVERLIDIF